jgi:hypothetical protein
VEAPRSVLVRVPLSAQEAEVVRAAAAGVGLTVGAWVGDVAVRQARDDAVGVLSAREPSSWRDLVAALVALRIQALQMASAVPAVDEALPVPAVDPPPSPSIMPNGFDVSHHTDDDKGVLARVRRLDAAAAAVAAVNRAMRRQL